MEAVVHLPLFTRGAGSFIMVYVDERTPASRELGTSIQTPTYVFNWHMYTEYISNNLGYHFTSLNVSTLWC